MKKIEEKLKRLATTLKNKYKITPEILPYIRIFSAPWVALFINFSFTEKGVFFPVITILLYILFSSSILFEKLLEVKKNILSDLADKIFIVFSFIGFGLNLFTFLIIIAESVLTFKLIFFKENKEDLNEKIKLILQILLPPFILLQNIMSFIPDMLAYFFIIVTIVFSYIVVYKNISEYFYFEKN